MAKRWIYFLLSILVGFIFALILGWYVFPTHTGNASPDSLRSDYKTDFVLMIAEIYNQEKNVTEAVKRLAPLGKDNPSEIVQEALQAAEPHYAPADLDLIRNLLQALLPGGGGSSQ